MITRYAMSWGKDEDGSIYVSPTEQPKGNWVKYEDYARLQQELARLRASSFVTAVPCEHYERVVKAGDAMACHLVCSDLPNDVCGNLMKKWNAAKEGKPSV